MLHGILVFYVIITYFSYPKIHVKNLVCPKCAQIVFFTQKWRQKRLRGNLHEALFFNGREGGIRTHGGSSPHLISSYFTHLFQFLCVAASLDGHLIASYTSALYRLISPYLICEQAVKKLSNKTLRTRQVSL